MNVTDLILGQLPLLQQRKGRNLKKSINDYMFRPGNYISSLIDS